nr:MAG TPA: hypothetical protein [Caudoviricetes sp.]
MSPGELAAVVSATGAALGGLVTAASVLTGLHWGREKAKADAELAREQVGKARAERIHTETTAQLEAIAGGIDARLGALEEALQTVRHEVTPNHGGSVKDAVLRIEAAQGSIMSALDAHGQVLDAHGQVLAQITERQDRDAADIGARITSIETAARTEHDLLRTAMQAQEETEKWEQR